MSKGYIEIRDYVDILPSSVSDFRAKLKDDIEVITARQALHVDIVATHAGKLTRNNTFYPPQYVREGAKTFVEHFGKPFLVHHDIYHDPIGRVTKAEYVDISNTITNAAIKAGIASGLVDSRAPMAKIVDAVMAVSDKDPGILQDPAFSGLGFIQLQAAVTDAEAARKILDGRYLTVSVGMTSNKAVCSVCRRDWVEEGPCEHIPGKTYEDKLAFLVTGNLRYEEVSVVNAPADNQARIISVRHGNYTDSITLDILRPMAPVHAVLSFQDSVNNGGTAEMDKNKQAEAEAKAKAEAEAKAKAEAEAKAKADADKVAAEAAAQAKQDAAATAAAAEKDAADKVKLADAEDQKFYDDMLAFGATLGLFVDKTLTPEERKGMKVGTFCKPGERKYPIPDCNHARVAMAYAKKNNESSSVVACIRRKAKALGCPFSDEFEKEIDAVLGDSTPELKPDATPEQKEAVQAAAKCESCDALKKQVEALEAELKDSKAQKTDEQKGLIDSLEKTRKVLMDGVAGLEALASGKVADEKGLQDMAALKLEDLLKRAEEAKTKLNFKDAIAKLHDGMSRNPTATVEDPTQRGNQDPTNKQSDGSDLSRYAAIYKELLTHKGLTEADAYLNALKDAKWVPANFDPEAQS